MTFDDTLTQVSDLLRQQGRVSYQALKRRFDLDEDYVADLKAELIDARRVAADENGKVLVWTGEAAHQENTQRPPPSPVAYTPAHLADRIRSQQQAMEARGAPDGERKTITVLFADLKGSTALLEGLDPEVARAVIDPALQLMMDAVHRYEGYVAQALGDGILALFGAPLAHEDHAQRAVFAALRMQEEARRYSDLVRLKHGVPLALRVGINTGEVVVRSIRKDDLHTDYVPVGHSINLAARMEQMATPGSILVTEYTQKLVAGYFALKTLGAAEIKGVEHPLPVYEVTGVGQLRTRLQVAASRGLTRFVGRQQELQQMQSALAQAREGHGQVIGVMGEPGMGKSRLVHEFKARATGFAIFEAYSASHGKASPYLPITELLKSYFQIQLHDDEQTRREKVIGKLLGLDRALEEVLPYYFALLNIEDANSPLPQMDAQLRRRRTFEAMKKVVLRASLEQPLLLIFEDLHWIDSETQGYLDGLVESIGSARILLLANYRPEYRHDWGAKTYCTQLRLVPFGRTEAEEFLGILLGDPADTTTAIKGVGLRQWILEKTEGTPFFMEEVVQELFEREILQRDPNGKFLLSQAVITIQIPTTVQGILAARIDRLAPDEKALLQQLAVIGREFPLSLACAVVAMPDDELHRLLGALQKKEFLYEQPSFPEAEYLFKHALTQEVAYNTLLQETRKVIHQKAALAIEAAYHIELEDHYADLAHHYRRSDNVGKAIEYLALAGQQATRRAAHTEALNFLQAALALFEQQPKLTTSDEFELDLLLALIVPLHTTKGMTSEALERTCTRARTLCEQVANLDALMRVLLELRVFYTMRGDARSALAYAEECLGVAERLQNPRYLLQAYAALCIAQFGLGKLAACRDSAKCVHEYYAPGDAHWHQEFIGYDPFVLCLGWEGFAALLLGYPTEALKFEAHAIEISTQFYPYIQALGLISSAMVFAIRRNSSECLGNAEIILNIGLEFDYPDWIAIGTITHGLGMLGKDADAGLRELSKGLDAFESARVELFAPLSLCQSAEAHLRNGRPDLAQQANDRALGYVQRNAETFYEAEIHRVNGEIALVAKADKSARESAAEAHFLKAIEIAQQQKAKFWELRATLSLARLWAQQDKHIEARQRLAPVYEWFTEGFDTPDLQDAVTLLAGLAP